MAESKEGKTTGILIVNTGSPDSPDVKDVRKYLKEFLSDPAVMDIPFLARMLLLHFIILPRRPTRSAALYRKIWTEHGSPLVYLSQLFASGLESRLKASGANAIVESAMRYGNPSIESVLKKMKNKGIQRIIAVPSFPQHASATTGSVIGELMYQSGKISPDISIEYLPPFFSDEAYIRSLEKKIRTELHTLNQNEGFVSDFLLFTYHGLPESHIRKGDDSGQCLSSTRCCDDPQAPGRNCYRAQCVATTRSVAESLGYKSYRYGYSFQSRMGRAAWIGPHTDEVLKELPRRGIKKIAVVAPSFTVDCLETLEEIAMEGKETFLRAGGHEFRYISALNDDPMWIDAFAGMIQNRFLNSSHL